MTIAKKQVKGLGSVYYDASKKRWVGAIEIGQSGNRKRKRFTGKTQSDVVSKMKRYSAVMPVNNTSPNDILFSEFGIAYLENYKKIKLKPTSWGRDYAVLSNNILPRIGNYQLSKISSDVIQVKLINDIIMQGYSYSTTHKVYVLTNEIFKHALKKGLIGSNPCKVVEVPKRTNFRVKKKPIRVFTDEEIQMFTNYVLNHPRILNGKYLVSMIYTGLRVGEAAALTWNDIDFKNKVITVNKNIEIAYDTIVDGKPCKRIIQQDSTKTKETRKVFMTKSACKYLKEIHDSRRAYPEDYITLSQKEVSPAILEGTYRHICKAAGIPNPLGIHTLRHTCASLLIRNNVDIKIVSEMLGHSSVAFTYDTYVHIIEEHAKNVIEELDI